MSRSTNHFRRHVEDCLFERQDRERWLREARTIARRHYPSVRVSDRDWRIWGHVSPEEWLAEWCFPPDWDDLGYAEDEDDWFGDFDDDPCGEPFGREPFDPRDWEPDWDDAGEDIEWLPAKTEYGGRLYPRGDVEDVRKQRGTDRRR